MQSVDEKLCGQPGHLREYFIAWRPGCSQQCDSPLGPGSLRSALGFLIFRRWRPGSLSLPVRASPGPLGAGAGPAVLAEQLDVPVVETDGAQQHQEDERQHEAEAGLVLVDQAVGVVVVVGVPTPVENNHS